MSTGRSAAVLGSISLILMAVAEFSYQNGGGIKGPLVYAFHWLFTSTVPVTEPEMWSTSILTVYEASVRRLVVGVAIMLAIFSGVLSQRAAKTEVSSLWYSAAILLSATTVATLSFTAGMVDCALFTLLAMKNRSWKMTNA